MHGEGSLKGNLYYLHCKPVPKEIANTAADNHNELDLWHQRLGHLNQQSLKEMALREMARGVRLPTKGSLKFCKGCVVGKMHRKSFKSVGAIASKRKLQLVHSDVKGPKNT